jgi:hypothetical protein
MRSQHLCIEDHMKSLQIENPTHVAKTIELNKVIPSSISTIAIPPKFSYKSEKDICVFSNFHMVML